MRSVPNADNVDVDVNVDVNNLDLQQSSSSNNTVQKMMMNDAESRSSGEFVWSRLTMLTNQTDGLQPWSAQLEQNPYFRKYAKKYVDQYAPQLRHQHQHQIRHRYPESTGTQDISNK